MMSRWAGPPDPRRPPNTARRRSPRSSARPSRPSYRFSLKPESCPSMVDALRTGTRRRTHLVSAIWRSPSRTSTPSPPACEPAALSSSCPRRAWLGWRRRRLRRRADARCRSCLPDRGVCECLVDRIADQHAAEWHVPGLSPIAKAMSREPRRRGRRRTRRLCGRSRRAPRRRWRRCRDVCRDPDPRRYPTGGAMTRAVGHRPQDQRGDRRRTFKGSPARGVRTPARTLPRVWSIRMPSGTGRAEEVDGVAAPSLRPSGAGRPVRWIEVVVEPWYDGRRRALRSPVMPSAPMLDGLGPARCEEHAPEPSGATSTIIRAASPRTSAAWPGASVQS